MAGFLLFRTIAECRFRLNLAHLLTFCGGTGATLLVGGRFGCSPLGNEKQILMTAAGLAPIRVRQKDMV
jgi:hypothetical protein